VQWLHDRSQLKRTRCAACLLFVVHLLSLSVAVVHASKQCRWAVQAIAGSKRSCLGYASRVPCATVYMRFDSNDDLSAAHVSFRYLGYCIDFVLS
jgi:F0F1-type ATP synthase assembly protein I